jgi:hypothetical protein
MKKLSSFTKLSRNEQRHIKGGVFICSRCTRLRGGVIACTDALLICNDPTCNNACNGNPSCFISCSEGGEGFD